MSDFLAAFKITNGNEGGWQNDPNDSGNAASGIGTYRGIASAKQPDWRGWPIVKAAIANMTKQPHYGTDAYRSWVKTLNSVLAANTALQGMVQAFFKTGFWDVNSLTSISNQAVANKVYDCGVNCGTGTAAILLQRCVGTKPDGSIGPVTLAAANAMNGATLAASFREVRIAHYRAVVTAHPQDAQYLDEWISRC